METLVLELGFVAGDLVQAAFDRVGFLEAGGEVDVGDPFRDLLVEADVEVRDDRERREDHDHAERALQQRPATGPAHAVEQGATTERQPEQDDPGPERIGDRHRDRAPAGGADRDHGREDRAGAGGVDEPERGAHEQPRAKTVPRLSSDPNAANRESRASSRSPIAGTSSTMPVASSTTTAMSRNGSEPSPTPPTTFAIPTIVTVNVIISPSTTPSGRRRPPTPPEASSAGSTGSTQGESAVPAPARMAKRIRISMGGGGRGEMKLVQLP